MRILHKFLFKKNWKKKIQKVLYGMVNRILFIKKKNYICWFRQLEYLQAGAIPQTKLSTGARSSFVNEQSPPRIPQIRSNRRRTLQKAAGSPRLDGTRQTTATSADRDGPPRNRHKHAANSATPLLGHSSVRRHLIWLAIVLHLLFEQQSSVAEHGEHHHFARISAIKRHSEQPHLWNNQLKRGHRHQKDHNYVHKQQSGQFLALISVLYVLV